MTPAPRRGGRPRSDDNALDVGRIIDAAWHIVERDGVDSLSTRTLAVELQVKGPALYWHIKNKQQLLSLMVERALGETIERAPRGVRWDEWLIEIGRSQRANLLRRRDSGIIASRAPPSERMQREIVPAAMEPMVAAGFSEQHAARAIGGLASLVLGWVIYEQNPETREFLVSMNAPDEAFAHVLESYVAGLASRQPDVAR